MAKVTITLEDKADAGLEAGQIGMTLNSDPPVPDDLPDDQLTPAQDAGLQMIMLYEAYQARLRGLDTENMAIEADAANGVETIILGNSGRSKTTH